MSHIIGLDISTSCTGWCVVGPEGNLVEIGHIPLSKINSAYKKASKVRSVLAELHIRHDITNVFIEENLQAFRPGLSSAKTLLTLARFNGIISYIAQEQFFCMPEFLNVNVARKAVGLKIISKRKGGAPTKEQVLDWVKEKITCDWPTKTLKSGPRKDLTIPDPGCYDMADAYVIALAGSSIRTSEK